MLKVLIIAILLIAMSAPAFYAVCYCTDLAGGKDYVPMVYTQAPEVIVETPVEEVKPKEKEKNHDHEEFLSFIVILGSIFGIAWFWFGSKIGGNLCVACVCIILFCDGILGWAQPEGWIDVMVILIFIGFPTTAYYSIKGTK